MSDQKKKNYALLCDVDMTLLPSMSTDVPAERRALADKIYTMLGGAFALVTGRPAHSLDESFPAQFPASVEHHSAWRPEKGTEFSALAPHIDADELAAHAEDHLKDMTVIFTAKEEVLEEQPGVFIECKKFSLALVFSPHATSEQHLESLRNIINTALEKFNLAASHRMAEGSDAVELVPQNLCKGEAVRHFMDTEAFRGKTPIFIGDGIPDMKAMQVCAEEFGGFGIAVGDRIPDEPYVQKRLKSVDDVWAYLENFASEQSAHPAPAEPKL